MSDVMLAFANAKAGRERAFDAWYTGEHLPAVLAVEGILGARRMASVDDLRGAPEHPYRFLAIYDVASREGSATADRVLAARPPMSDDTDGTPMSWWFQEAAPRVAHPDAGSGPFDQMVVLTNANPGTDEAFNRWYDEIHVPDVLNTIGGYVAATRYRRIEGVILNRNCPWGYMALYDIPKGRMQHCLDRIAWSRAEREEALAAGREPRVPIAPAMGEQRLSWFYAETVPHIRAARAQAA